MATVGKSALLSGRLDGGTVTVDGLGEIKIRPLVRGQALQVQNAPEGEQRDNLILHFGMVDPALTLAEVQQWADTAPAGELAKVGLAIATLSGMLDGQAKEATKSTPRRR